MKEPTLKDSRRMCKARDNCEDCPLSPACHLRSFYYVTDEQIAKVAEWVEKHPPKTRLDKLREVFPAAQAKICPKYVNPNYQCPNQGGECLACCSECWAKYWNQEA